MNLKPLGPISGLAEPMRLAVPYDADAATIVATRTV